MNEIERKQKILEEIIADAIEKEPKRRPGEFTCLEFSKMLGCGKYRSRRVIKEKIKDGTLKARVTSHGIYYSVV